MVPAYMSYVTGQSLGKHRAEAEGARARAALLSLSFVLGFSAVFVTLGASATALSRLLLQYRYEAGIAGGALVTLFGAVMLIGVERIPFLRRDLHFEARSATGNTASAFARFRFWVDAMYRPDSWRHSHRCSSKRVGVGRHSAPRCVFRG